MLGTEIIALTLEEPWRENRRRVSCVPAGSYECERHNGPRFKNVWRLKDVPERDGILIHSGNTVDDVEGCILVGNAFRKIGGKDAVLNSRVTLDKLRAMLPETFTLVIHDA